MWPDWREQTVCVIAAGASAQDAVAAIPRRVPCIVVNRSFELAPWADVLYAADGVFWDVYPASLKFVGIKATGDERAIKRHPELRRVVVQGRVQQRPSELVREPVGTVGSGGNSGFQAINLAAQFGAARIVLIGMDYCGGHWHRDHVPPLQNATAQSMATWRADLDGVANTLKAWGIEVLNASSISSLKAYPKVDIREVLSVDDGRCKG